MTAALASNDGEALQALFESMVEVRRRASCSGSPCRQALQLILMPGLTTKERITNISGRGVGMDVVKTNIQRLNGRVEGASTPGAGTTIVINLPVIEALFAASTLDRRSGLLGIAA